MHSQIVVLKIIKLHHNLSNWNFELHCALFRACLEPLGAFTCDMREIQSSQSSQPRRHGLTTRYPRYPRFFSLEFSSALDEGFVRLTATHSHLGLREVHCHPHPIASLESDLTEQGEQSLEKFVPAESLPVPLSEGDGTVGIGQLGQGQVELADKFGKREFQCWERRWLPAT